MSPRPIILHFHIFKNAGSTVDWALRRNFESGFVATDGPRPGDRLGPDTILSHIEDSPSTSAISSHQFRFPLPQHPGYRFLPLIFLRQPMDRALSVYNFERRQAEPTPGSLKAKQSSFDDYVAWRLQSGPVSVLANFQTAMLSFRHDESPTRPVAPADRALAERHLRIAIAPGVVERLDESLVCAEQVLQQMLPSIDLCYVRQNVGRDGTSSREERIATARARLGATLADELEARNAEDFRLHAEANRLLDARIKRIDGFAAKLAAFRERCAALL